MIGPAALADASRAAALIRATTDDRLSTDAGMRYRMATARPEDRLGYWKAEHEGELIGWAYARINSFAPTATAGFAGIIVASSHRRRGIGGALWDEVSAHVQSIGVRRLVVYGEDEADALSFAAARGFTLAATQASLAVDPRSIEPPSFVPPDVRLRPFALFADDPRPIYDADYESILDEPGAEDFSGVTFENWRRHHWEHPDCDRDLGFVAIVEGEVAGVTFLMTDRQRKLAVNGGTSVKRAFRGRGLGLLMKRTSLAAAAQAGIVRVITQNDETNAPMIAINERLGYTPFSTAHSWVLER